MTMETMTNAQGHLVPIDKVRPQDRLQDELVTALFLEARAVEQTLSLFKRKAFDHARGFQALLAQEYGVTRGGTKGNVTLTSFDGLIKLEISNQEFIAFGPELQAAKALIDECIIDWGREGNANIQTLVMDAFRVDRNQRVNTQRILALRKFEMNDDRWSRAMTAINDSIRVASSKQYIRFYARPTPEGNWESVKLDIAGV